MSTGSISASKLNVLKIGAWGALLGVLRQSDEITSEQFVAAINDLSLPFSLKKALIAAVRGDQDAMNDWLFSLPANYEEPIVWLAHVKEKQPYYAWMIGFVSELASDIQARFQAAELSFLADPVLAQKEVPLPIRYVAPFEVSPITGERGSEYDRFAIFQTGRKAGSVGELKDSQQRFILNARYLVDYRRKVIERARLLGVAEGALTVLQEDLPLIAHVHAEGHNRGHFMGPWPLNPGKKACLLYEALEEVRACATVVLQAKYIGLSECQLDALALNIFLVRFLGYCFDSFRFREKRRSSAREITIGVMFFETLMRSGGVRLTKYGNGIRMEADASAIRKQLETCVKEIHEAEQRAVEANFDSSVLRVLAREWYHAAFPQNGKYSPDALTIFEFLQGVCNESH